MPVRKNKPTEVFDEQKFNLKIIEHVDLKTKIDGLTKTRATVTEHIKKVLPTVGTTRDSGSIVYEGTAGNIITNATNSLRVSTAYVPEVEEILLNDKFGKKYIRKDVTLVMDVEAFEADIQAGKVPAELAERVFTIKKVYALTTSIKDTTVK